MNQVTDVEDAASHLEYIGRMTDKGVTDFKVDKTALHWKRMSSPTSIVIDQKSMPGLKASVDSLALLLRANALRDFNLKTMFTYHYENPGILGYNKSTLSVPYRSNNTDWMTAHLFTTWFTKYFKSIFETYYSEKNIHSVSAHNMTMNLLTQEH